MWSRLLALSPVILLGLYPATVFAEPDEKEYVWAGKIGDSEVRVCGKEKNLERFYYQKYRYPIRLVALKEGSKRQEPQEYFERTVGLDEVQDWELPGRQPQWQVHSEKDRLVGTWKDPSGKTLPIALQVIALYKEDSCDSPQFKGDGASAVVASIWTQPARQDLYVDYGTPGPPAPITTRVSYLLVILRK